MLGWADREATLTIRSMSRLPLSNACPWSFSNRFISVSSFLLAAPSRSLSISTTVPLILDSISRGSWEAIREATNFRSTPASAAKRFALKYRWSINSPGCQVSLQRACLEQYWSIGGSRVAANASSASLAVSAVFTISRTHSRSSKVRLTYAGSICRTRFSPSS